jgi:hypothetical protein
VYRLCGGVAEDSGASPVHYTWMPTNKVGERLEVAPECRGGILDSKFLEGEENLSLLLTQVSAIAGRSSAREHGRVS